MKNICKFPQSSLHASLSVSCFVMETSVQTMREPVLLKHHRMILVMQGQGTFQFDSHTAPFSAGNLFFAFQNETFSVGEAIDVMYLYIDFDGGRAEDLLHRFGIQSNHRSYKGYEGLLPFWRDSLSRAQEDTIDLAAESTLLYTFSRFRPQTDEYDKLIDKILKITDEDFRNPELSVSGIAHALSYNPKYLSHTFKKKMKVSYSEYLRDIRIEYAISLFNEGLDSVKNVALLSGFADPLYFSNIFKKTVGISPREYILTLQKDGAAQS